MNNTVIEYDVVVVGGGHAGCEAALASARMGLRTVLVTSSVAAIATMPCNPSIGGLAKSHLVYELDALGGEMGRNADASALQSKMLNTSRGPAVQATRTQCAKKEYAERMQSVIHGQENLDVIEASAEDIICNDSKPATACTGVRCTTSNGATIHIRAKAVVITAGTSLRGRIWIGKHSQPGGGDCRPACDGLSAALERLGFTRVRLKQVRRRALMPILAIFPSALGRTDAVHGHCSTWNIPAAAKTIVPRGTIQDCRNYHAGKRIQRPRRMKSYGKPLALRPFMEAKSRGQA